MFQVYKLRAPQEVLSESCSKYFVNPVSFESLSERIKNRAFHSADEFLSEVKWMQHNALILDSGGKSMESLSSDHPQFNGLFLPKMSR